MNDEKIILFSILILALFVSVACVSLSDASEGEEEPVASIGEVKYTNLQAAIDAASDGDVVTLESDIFLTEGGGNYAFLITGKSITIDLNGYRIEQGTSSSHYISIIATKVADTPTHLILKDSSEKGTGCIYTCGIAYSMDAAVLIWNDTSNSASDDGKECSITFEGGTYHAEAVSNGDGMVYTCCGTVIEGENIKKGVWVKGGNFILDNVGEFDNGSPWVFNAKGRNDNSLMVTGGNYNSGVQDQYWSFEVDVPKQYALKDNGDGMHVIVDAVCYVNVHRDEGIQLYGCESFEEALSLIENKKGDTITMIEECCIDKLNLNTIYIEFNLASEKGLYILNETSLPSNVQCVLAPGVKEGCTYHKSSSIYPCLPGECTVCQEPIVPAVGHEYRDGEESITCIDRDCAVCGTKGVLPSTTGHGPSESEATMTCIDRDCSICGGKGLIKGDGIHEFDASMENMPCISRTCTLCHGNIAPSENHKDSDLSKTCVNRPCSVCGTEGVFIGDGKHEFDASVENMPCISRTCTLCHGNIAPSENHKDSDPSKTCVNRPCSVCGTEDVFEHSSDHTPSENETDMTCISRTCHICKEFVIEATEGHTFEEGLEDITCTDRTCIVCHTLMKATSKHTYADGEESITCIDMDCAVCGRMEFPSTTDHEPSGTEKDMTCKDRTCHICKEFVIEATEGHTFEDMDATCTDRECLVCSGTFEHTTDHVYELDENDDSVCTLCGEVLEKEGEDHVSVSYVAIAMVTVLAGSLLLIGRGGL